MKTYFAERGFFDDPDPFNVWVDDGKAGVYKLPPRLDLANKSPTGFAWGYWGSGPAQLSLAILADLYNDRYALQNFQMLKRHLIGTLTQTEGWRLTEKQIRETMQSVLP